MESADPWCWLCQTHHEPVNLSARLNDGFGHPTGFARLLVEIRRWVREQPVARRRAAMRTEYHRRTRARSRR